MPIIGRVPRGPARGRSRRYHHGNLPSALVVQALRIIHKRGVDGLTLRELAADLGVSRTALYRHFADKSALLAAVAAEGFRALRTDLLAARPQLAEDAAAIGVAYVRFAAAHPAQYRVMFDGGDRRAERSPAGAAAFVVFVEAVAAQQNSGRLRPDDPAQLAKLVWAIVHGIARFAIDGQLDDPGEAERLTRYALGRLRTGIAAAAPALKPA